MVVNEADKEIKNYMYQLRYGNCPVELLVRQKKVAYKVINLVHERKKKKLYSGMGVLYE